RAPPPRHLHRREHGRPQAGLVRPDASLPGPLQERAQHRGEVENDASPRLRPWRPYVPPQGPAGRGDDQGPAARAVYKGVRSAMANAENNYSLDPAVLRVADATADQGPSYPPRYRAKAR